MKVVYSPRSTVHDVWIMVISMHQREGFENWVAQEISPSGGGRGRLNTSWWRTYGTLLIHFHDLVLQSLASLAKHFGIWVLDSISHELSSFIPNGIFHLQSMPQMGKSFAAILQPSLQLLPHSCKTHLSNYKNQNRRLRSAFRRQH
jgi:prophage antirepressor-like protein